MCHEARRRPLFDADAFSCLRSLGLLPTLRESASFNIVMTEYIARHDLNDLQSLIGELEAHGQLSVERVPSRDTRYLKLKRKKGMHRGEAEAAAWALSQEPRRRPVFVSNDRAACRHARNVGVEVADLMDFIVECLDRGLLSGEEVRAKLAPWDDRRQQQCRPRDWRGYESTLEQRQANRPEWSVGVTGSIEPEKV